MNKPRPIEIAISVVIGLIVLALIPSRTDTTWVDPITGSLKRQTRWLVSRDPVIKTSALERWIVRHEGSHVPTWRRVSETQSTFFGLGLSVACWEPPMFLLRAGDINDRFVRNSTDERIARFVQVMRTGSEIEKRSAIRAAYASPKNNPEQGDKALTRRRGEEERIPLFSASPRLRVNQQS